MEAIGYYMLLLFAPMATCADARQYTTDDVVDLSTALITNESMYWPTYPYGYRKTQVTAIQTEKYWAEAHAINMSIHTGTHLDAPCHLTPNKDVQRLHEVPITRFFGAAAVIDIKEKVDNDSNYGLSMDDMKAWEEKNGRVPDGAIVLVHTGWAKRFYGDMTKYYGTMDPTKPELLSFPGVLPDVATFLLNDRNINALGSDTGSPDMAQEADFPVHRTLLGNNRLIIENVAPTLELLPPTGYNIHAYPLKLHDTCGAPLRLMAFKNPDTSSAPAATASGVTRVATVAAAALLGLLLPSAL